MSAKECSVGRKKLEKRKMQHFCWRQIRNAVNLSEIIAMAALAHTCMPFAARCAVHKWQSQVIAQALFSIYIHLYKHILTLYTCVRWLAREFARHCRDRRGGGKTAEPADPAEGGWRLRQLSCWNAPSFKTRTSAYNSGSYVWVYVVWIYLFVLCVTTSSAGMQLCRGDVLLLALAQPRVSEQRDICAYVSTCC